MEYTQVWRSPLYYLLLLYKYKLLSCIITVEEYLEPDPKFNLCYCENCLEGRQDRKVYERGIPRKKYTVPIGWTRFSLK